MYFYKKINYLFAFVFFFKINSVRNTVYNIHITFIFQGNIILPVILAYSVKVTVLLFSLYALSRGAQTAENSANDLRRCLGKLLIYSPIGKSQFIS